MHRMRWPSLFICCGGDQLSPAGKYLSSCHSETSPNWSWESAFLSGRRTGPVIRVGAAAGLLLSQFPLRPITNAALEGKGSFETIGFKRLFCPLFQLLGKVGRRRHKEKATGNSYPPETRNHFRKGSNRRHFSSIAPTGQLSAASCAAARYSCGTGSVMACADSPGRMLNTSGHTPGHSPHWIQVSRWTYACIFLPPFAKQIGNIMPANRGY